jgi:hypothetical protein
MGALRHALEKRRGAAPGRARPQHLRPLGGVSGGDVYVLGHEVAQDGKTAAVLWKNGAAQKLGDGRAAYANSMWVR